MSFLLHVLRIFWLPLLLVNACQTLDSSDFTLNIEHQSDPLQFGDTLRWSLSNTKKAKIDNITVKINQNIQMNFWVANKTGTHKIEAQIEVEGQQIRTEKTFVVYAPEKPQLYGFELLNTYPHDIKAYTQGLEFAGEWLYESTGLYGSSSLRKVNFKTGEVEQSLPLDKTYFGEGLTVLNNNVFQLTWRENTAFRYDLDNFKLLQSFEYQQSSEGWGLCNDGTYLYKSDGSQKIWRLDPKSGQEIDFIEVLTDSKVLTKINELEWVNGKIYANTYQFNKEVGLIIDPAMGVVEGVIDFTGLKNKVTEHPKLDVLNGLAYHPERKTFFVTGKNWDKMFELKIILKQ